MVDVLDRMDPDKKRRLINAAMREFGENQFEKASTNVIVKEAGISKGLLYHYFRSKEELYEYLLKYAIDAVAVPIAEQIGLEDSDIITRIERIVKLKVEIFRELPALIVFSKAMYAGMDYDQIKEMVSKHNPISVEMYYSHNVDKSLFRDGVDVAMAVKTIQYVMEKISEEFIAARDMGLEPSMDQEFQQVEAYLAHFRYVYYKA